MKGPKALPFWPPEVAMGQRVGEAQGDQVQRTWFVWEDSSTLGWWRLFTTRGMRHCWAFQMIGPETCLVFNPHMHRMETEIVNYRAAHIIGQCKEAGLRVVVYERKISVYDPARDTRCGRGWIVTCASVLAYLVGLDFSWRCTPRQLYRALLRAGAEDL